MIATDSKALPFPVLRWKTFNTSTIGGSSVSFTANASRSIDPLTHNDQQVMIFSSSGPHNLTEGQIVKVTFPDHPEFEATAAIIINTINPTTGFLYGVSSLPSGYEEFPMPAASYEVIAIAQRAIVSASSANAAPVPIGPNRSVDHYSLKPGEQYLIEMPHKTLFDLADWFFGDANASALSVIYV